MIRARIAPLEPPYSPPVQAALDRIMPKGVPPLALFRTIAVNEPVFLRVMAGGLLDRGSISLREREIVIDRTCARCGSEYEWGVRGPGGRPALGRPAGGMDRGAGDRADRAGRLLPSDLVRHQRAQDFP